MTLPKLCYFCIASYGAIYGVGRTPLSALRDANQWLDRGEHLTLRDVDVPSSERNDGGLYLYKCTKGICDKVKIDGGAIEFEDVWNQYICLPEELEEVEEEI